MTNQFQIRPLRDSDATWIFEACQDEEIQKWTQIPRPYLMKHAIEFSKTLSGDIAVWAIEQKQSDNPLGVIGIHSINVKTGIADIGYWLAPWGRKKGAMRSGLALVISSLENNQDISIVEATIADENLASKQVVASLGFSEIPGSNTECKCGDQSYPARKFQLQIKGENQPQMLRHQ